MIEVSSVTLKRLKNNKLEKELPEFYELREVIENNDWHPNEPVFSHTISVLSHLEKLLKKYRKIKKPDEKIGNCTRKQLLFLSALLHDIGKKESIATKKGITYCPRHEIKGSLKAKKILDRINLSGKGRAFVISMIRNHGLAHKLAGAGAKSLGRFKAKNKSIFTESILLAMADTLGSRLKQKRPGDFRRRINFYKQMLNSIKNEQK